MNLFLQREAINFADYNGLTVADAYAILSSITCERTDDDD